MDKVNRHSKSPRTYGQFCALARSLDVVGDRWTLLIVRELLAGPMRFTELKTSLRGIATNLLSERLKTMEANGIVERRLQAAAVAYALTPWGAGLREAMEALGRWGAPLLATGQGDDAFQPRWLTLALPALLRGATSSPPVELGIETDGFLMVLRIDDDGPSAFVPDRVPASVFTAAPDVIVALVAGTIGIEQAVAAGEFRGDFTVLRTAFVTGRGKVSPPTDGD
ncbi:DNA-binding transcriptional regulator, HxlR family [Amycolatopsis lurida]|uniref:HxlR family transcriptional regulator n=1 Tax=Amycolatopsis lurida NRRL 2430 TaxID=1460371 RepID=A0A2P2FY89_AMYLU|nr:helix-turn-helix domain-containing protein [Amycolatopsis lurida]KFU81696.1 HxlR family transcriptional regulator [Amycolatopsis lurida NRRL 2430]SEB33465.1 DNA-binding transcriptional regulator, HxlR family [Amycolatopsis lurida]